MLRRREAEGDLTVSERAELDATLADLDNEEREALQDSMKRSQARQLELRQENEQLARKVGQLERIRGEHHQLLAEARLYLRPRSSARTSRHENRWARGGAGRARRSTIFRYGISFSRLYPLHRASAEPNAAPSSASTPPTPAASGWSSRARYC